AGCQPQPATHSEEPGVPGNSGHGRAVVHPHRHGIKGQLPGERSRDAGAERRGVVPPEVIGPFDRAQRRYGDWHRVALMPAVVLTVKLNVPVKAASMDDSLEMPHHGVPEFKANDRALIQSEKILEHDTEVFLG